MRRTEDGSIFVCNKREVGLKASLTAELVDCENQLMAEIADKRMKRRNVARTYALALRSSEHKKIDWKRVNEAIVERWSLYALEWIKAQAWNGNCSKEEQRKGKR